MRTKPGSPVTHHDAGLRHPPVVREPRISLRQLVLIATAASAVLGEVILEILSPDYRPWWYFLVLAAVVAAVLIWRPRVGQWVALAFVIAVTALPGTPQFVQVVFGSMLCMDTVVRGAHALAWLTVWLPAAGTLVFDHDPVTAAAWLILSHGLLALGFAIRRVIRDREAAREETYEIERETQRQLAAKIHDTAARDLSRILISIDRYSAGEQTGDPDVVLHQVENDLRSALGNLRSLIGNLSGTNGGLSGTNDHHKSLEELLAAWSRELSDQGRELLVDTSADLGSIPSQQKLLLAAVVAELAANSQKYAAPQTAVDVTITNDGEWIVVEQSNRIRSEAIPDQASGGTGLRRLSYLLGQTGGDLAQYQVGDMWIVVARIARVPACRGAPEQKGK